jgi:hypothetical protein
VFFCFVGSGATGVFVAAGFFTVCFGGAPGGTTGFGEAGTLAWTLASA